ncbi:MAG: lysophospholipid acyltransferase family protein [Proteobacteria bacterium]|nr:lysophospholipid acyltransferase family protein [Pseudomonadota bacterium]MBU4503410.1 lysophospholipid acyltransferase family protein [Pseudomonadota bacterium]
MKKKLKDKLVEIKWELIGILGKLLIDILFYTTRIELKGFEKVEPIINSRKFIWALWHSRLLLPNYLSKGLDGTAMVSGSEDGEFVARILKKQGHEAIRGSTTRGGIKALSALIRKLKEKQRPSIIIPDGPQGPRFKVKLGIIILARETGHPILPFSYSAKKIKVFASWDRFILPYPFTKCIGIYGNPLFVPKDADKNDLMRYRNLLEKELNRLTLEADSYFKRKIV